MPRPRRLLAPLAVLAAALAAAPPAGADPPDPLTQVLAAGTCATNAGVAFDGSSLYVSCLDDGHVDVVSPRTGALQRSFKVTGATALGALAWDGVHGALYGCTDTMNVARIDTATGATTPLFKSPKGCFDGLAYDGADDTFWTSPDSSSPLTHSTRAGVTLASFDVTARLEGYGNSGIAAGWDRLWLANASGDRIFSADKGLAAVTRFAPEPARISDLECDGDTFRPLTALWAISSFSRRLFATEIAGNTCTTGGTRPDLTAPTVTVLPDTPPNEWGWNNTVVRFTIQAADPKADGEPTSGVRRLHYTLEGATKGDFFANGDRATVSVFSSGTTKVTASALDYAGNTSAVATNSVQQEFQPPTISITPPDEGDVLDVGKPFSAQYSCTDALSGVLTCDATQQGAPGARAAAPRDGGPVGIDTSRRGARSVTVISRDRAGNVAGLVRHFNVGAPATAQGAASKLCGSRRKVRITLSARKGPIRTIAAYRGKKKLASGKGRRILVSLKGLPRTAVQIRVVGVTARGRKVTTTRTYHPCQKKGT